MTPRPLLAASALLLLAAPARAERPHEALTLAYLPSRAVVALCPVPDVLALELRLRLGYELIQPSASHHLTVKLERSGRVFRSRGEIRDDEGKVTFSEGYEGVDCTEVVLAMSTLVAFPYTKPQEEPLPPPAPLPPAPSLPASPPAVESPALKPVAPEPPEPHRPPVLPVTEKRSTEISLASVFSFGVAPVVVGGIAGSAAIRWKTSSLELEGSALFAPSATFKHVSPSGDYRYVVLTAAFLGCYHLSWGFVCGRAEGSLASIDNSTSKVKIAGDHPDTFGFGPRLGGELRVKPWLAVRFYGEIILRPLANQLLNVDTNERIWRSRAASASIGLGPVFTFPEI